MLFNKTKNIKITEEIRYAYGIRFLGLIFADKNKFNYSLIFDFCGRRRLTASIHTIFVFFDILVVYLNDNKIVVEKEIIKPFTINYTPKQIVNYLIELPKKCYGLVDIGDELVW